MSSTPALGAPSRVASLFRFNTRFLPVTVTVALFAVMFGAGSTRTSWRWPSRSASSPPCSGPARCSSTASSRCRCS